MKYCQKCGKELLDDAVICMSCGCAVSPSRNNATPDKNYNNHTNSTNDALGIVSIVLGAIGIPLSLLLAIMGYIFGGAGLAMAIISSKKNPLSNKGKVGLILSIITLSCSFINSLMGILLFMLALLGA